MHGGNNLKFAKLAGLNCRAVYAADNICPRNDHIICGNHVQDIVCTISNIASRVSSLRLVVDEP